MARRRRFHSNTVRTVGALLPSDVLAMAMEGDGLDGLDRKAFGLPKDVRIRDEINTAWNEATALWWSFVRELRDLPEDEATATSSTREKWLLPLLGLLGFDDIDTLSSAVEVGGTDYPISHMRGHTPLHLMGARIGLDDRASGIRGAARLSPHSLTQQFLNRSDDHLWGIVTNGLRLRVLRDSVSLTRQAFVEFDLEAMFNGQVFSDFVLLYRVAHATRFDGDRPEECLLERWIAAARDEGIRALDRLRDGVEEALTTLGSGFLGHPSNTALRSQVEVGDVAGDDMYRYLLRLVYRLLFLFVAEDRDLLHVPDATPEQRDRYERFYSTSRLRELSARPIGAGNSDLWRGLTALMGVFGRDEGAPALGLPGLGSFLWSEDAIGPLSVAALDNEDLLVAIRGLAQIDEDGSLRRIDFAGLGAEELGSVYESLLELHPRIDTDEWQFTLGGGAGSERKTTGSYYTPTELISELLDSALMPVLERAASSDAPEQAILALKVVDPAAGSGHFLIAAAHRIGKRLAEVRTGEPEPPEEAYRAALRDVISRCIYAVDINELAVELCKVSLWLEALEPGKPLSFLDHHIVVGNSLFGATPAAIESGIPDEAFAALRGDDKKVVAAQKKRNRDARKGQEPLAFVATPDAIHADELVRLEDLDDSDIDSVHEKERLLADWKQSSEFAHAKVVADLWCAAFVIPRNGRHPELTEVELRHVERGASLDPGLRREVNALSERYRFFHWHLAFPAVFGPSPRREGATGVPGFDVVLGNPPWERVKLQEKEWFAQRHPEIAGARNKAERAKLIRALDVKRPALYASFQEAQRQAEATSLFLRVSGRYPLCGRGDVNTFAVFAELMRSIGGSGGRVGSILPTGIATQFTTQDFFWDLVESRSLVSFFGFQNEARLFPAIDHRVQFALVTICSPGDGPSQFRSAFYLHRPSDIRDPDRVYVVSADDIQRINPNTRSAPAFASARDASIVTGIYSRVPVLQIDEQADPWSVTLTTQFHMSGDSDLFATEAAPGLVPLYEAKMIHLFDHRFGTYENQRPAQARQGKLPEMTDAEKTDPAAEPLPRYWVPLSEFEQRVEQHDQDWPLAWREVAGATVLRTLVCTALPRVAVGHKLQLIYSKETASRRLCLLANLGSLALDYVSRQKLGGSGFSFFVMKQLPVLPPSTYDSSPVWLGESSLATWVADRVLELVYTSHSMRSAADDIGRQGPPFVWEPTRRRLIRAELDALFFHLYGLGRDDAEYALSTFRVLVDRETSQRGRFETGESVLEAFDRLDMAMRVGRSYESALSPPPADESCRHEVAS